MTRREWIDECLKMGEVYEDYPFDLDKNAPEAWTLIRHKANRKAFVFLFERNGLILNLKCEPLRAEFLRRVFCDVTPAYHMNKTHWNSVRVGGDVPDEMVRELIRQSFALTAPRNAKSGAAGKDAKKKDAKEKDAKGKDAKRKNVKEKVARRKDTDGNGAAVKRETR